MAFVWCSNVVKLSYGFAGIAKHFDSLRNSLANYDLAADASFT